jgi:hypothetical protein
MNIARDSRNAQSRIYFFVLEPYWRRVKWGLLSVSVKNRLKTLNLLPNSPFFYFCYYHRHHHHHLAVESESVKMY